MYIQVHGVVVEWELSSPVVCSYIHVHVHCMCESTACTLVYCWYAFRVSQLCSYALYPTACVCTGMSIPAGGITMQVDSDGRETGEAYVEFTNPDDAEKALYKDRQMIGHR